MRNPPRRIRGKFDTGEPVFGAAIQLYSPEVVEMAGYCGLDFVWLDAEHGTMDVRDIADLVRAADAAGIDAIVRVPDGTPSFILRVLDSGAAGVVVPHMKTSEDAAAVVAACKYAPEGNRGACPTPRVVGHSTMDWLTDYRQINRDVFVFGLIEDPEGVENIEQILKVDGFNGVVFGPHDLAQSLGVEGQIGHQRILEMLATVVASTRQAGKDYISIPSWEPGGLAAAGNYSRMFVISGDRGLIAEGFRASLAEAHKVLDVRQEPTAV